MSWSKEKLSEHYYKRQAWLFDYLEKHPCVDCGETNILTLQFDNTLQRKFTISEIIMGSMKKILAEISKCEVVCGSCHSVRTHRRANTLRWQYAARPLGTAELER